MKRGIILCLVFFSFLSFVLGSFSGVAPSSYNIDFKPNLRQEFIFTFIFEKGVDSEIYVTGDFKEHVKILKEEKELRNGRKRVYVELNLPTEADKPGLNIIRVGAIEKPTDHSGISISADVSGLIRVRVPYPGKYAELNLKTSNANAGEKVPYELTVYSRGKESIFITPKLEIKNIDGLFEIISLEKRTVNSNNNTVYKGFIETKDYKPGDYNLTAIVDYEGKQEAKTTALFRLGELNVRLVNYTREINAGKINRFNIEIESLWNNEIKEVYGTMTVIGYPDIYLQTPTISLTPWRKTQIVGFIDATEIKANVVHAEITLFFDGESKTEIIEINIIHPINWTLILLITGGIIIALLILTIFTIIITLLIKRKK